MHFNTKAVSRIVGLTLRQIDYWDRTHFIKPSVSEAMGTGSVRLYSFSDLIQLKVAKALMDKGITLQKIRKAILYLKKNMPDVKRPLSAIRFLTDGNTLFVITKDDEQIVDTLKQGQLVFALALGDLIEELRVEVIDLEKRKGYSVYIRGRKYRVTLRAETADASYSVEYPEIPGCASRGDSVEEALDRIKDAIKWHLDAQQENGEAERNKSAS